MKVSIIGGGGLVGSCAGFALQAGKIVREINLVDVNQDLCEGQALDLLHGASILSDQKITATGTEGVKDADVVVITAGLRRKPDESRLDLINRNVTLFRGILADIKKHGYRKDLIVFVVSNPVDVLTYLAIKELGLPPHRSSAWERSSTRLGSAVCWLSGSMSRRRRSRSPSWASTATAWSRSGPTPRSPACRSTSSPA